jgi:tetratricopeptide (TPR) repeat protein
MGGDQSDGSFDQIASARALAERGDIGGASAEIDLVQWTEGNVEEAVLLSTWLKREVGAESWQEMVRTDIDVRAAVNPLIGLRALYALSRFVAASGEAPIAALATDLLSTGESALREATSVQDVLNCEQILGDSLSAVASAALRNGAAVDAEALLSAAATRAQTVLGVASPVALGLIVNLTTLLLDNGRLEEAEVQLHRCLAEPSFPASSEEGLNVLYNLAKLHNALGQQELAIAVLRQATVEASNGPAVASEVVVDIARALRDLTAGDR